MPCGDEGFLYDSRRQGPGLVPLVFDFTTYADVWYGCCILRSYQYQHSRPVIEPIKSFIPDGSCRPRGAPKVSPSDIVPECLALCSAPKTRNSADSRR